MHTHQGRHLHLGHRPLGALLRSSAIALLVHGLAVTAAAQAEVAAAATADAADADEVVVEGDTGRRLDGFLADLDGFSGAVAVVEDGQVVLLKGYGFADRAEGVANTPLTVFTTASLTKGFTAAAILELARQGLLSVDDPLGLYFDEVPADKAGITLHHLLTHTAGLPPAIGDDFEPITRSAYVAQALSTPLLHEPGSRFAYSNVGYSLLGAVVEQVSGRSYDAFMKRTFFEPLGMSRSGYVLPDLLASEFAHGYSLRGEDLGTLVERTWASDGPYWHLRGNGGLHSSVADAVRWYRSLVEHTVLDEASTTAMFTPYAPLEDSPASYGYGWGIVPTERGTVRYTHLGGSEIATTAVNLFPDENALVYLVSNTRRYHAADVAPELTRALFDPGYAPQVRAAEVGTMGVLPDSPVGERAAELMALIAGADEATIRTFVETALGDRFLADASVDDYLALVRDLQRDLLEPTLVTVEVMSEHQLSFILASARTGQMIRLELGVEFGPPHRLNNLGIRPVDPPESDDR